MQRNEPTQGQQEPQNQTGNNERINPFKETSNEKAGELSPKEEAAAEQQRKEALTERD